MGSTQNLPPNKVRTVPNRVSREGFCVAMCRETTIEFEYDSDPHFKCTFGQFMTLHDVFMMLRTQPRKCRKVWDAPSSLCLVHKEWPPRWRGSVQQTKSGHPAKWTRALLGTFCRPPTSLWHLHRNSGECGGPPPELW